MIECCHLYVQLGTGRLVTTKHYLLPVHHTSMYKTGIFLINEIKEKKGNSFNYVLNHKHPNIMKYNTLSTTPGQNKTQNTFNTQHPITQGGI